MRHYDCGDITGEIKEYKDFPSGSYSKEEVDTIIRLVEEKIGTKADKVLMDTILTEMNKKANSSDLLILAEKIAEKADKTAVSEAISEVTDPLAERIYALEHPLPELVIKSLTVNPKSAELGTNTAVTISWTLSRDEQTASINGNDVKGVRKYNDTVSQTTEYKLIVTDEKGNKAEASTKIDFMNRIYWGVSSDSSLTEAKVKSLKNNTLSDAKSRTISIDATDQFVYYALPKRLGTVTFRLGQFTGGFEDPVTLQVTNQHGYAEEYYIYRSSQQYTAAVDFVVS